MLMVMLQRINSQLNNACEEFESEQGPTVLSAHHQIKKLPELSTTQSRKDINHRLCSTDKLKGTLPTPVGPKNKKEATGRFGACNPARDIRTASLTEDKTSS
jgi:hypothetical protein